MTDRREWKEKQLALLWNEWKGCKRCPLSDTRVSVVFGSGNHDPEVLLIGEGPGGEEDLTGKPFVGEAGSMLNHMFKLSGLNKDQFYLSNTVMCRPTVVKENRVQDRPPSKAEITPCLPRLHRLIYILDPLVVVNCGMVPTKVFAKFTNLASAAREMYPVRVPGVTTGVTYAGMTIPHPSGLLRDAHHRDRFSAAVDQLIQLRRTLNAFHYLAQDRPCPSGMFEGENNDVTCRNAAERMEAQ